MANWGYKGITKDGEAVSGKLAASSQKEVRKQLRAKGIRAREIEAPSILEFDIGQWMVDKGLASAFSPKDLLRFTKQLSIMINAGVPLIQGLEILYKSEKQLTLKGIIQNVATDVGAGKTISESLSSQKGFSRLYCSLVKAGEAGGVLDVILEKLGIHLDKQEKIKSQLKSAMTYPAVVVFVGIGVIWGMMVFVVPQFVDMLKDTGQEPPWITQFIMDCSYYFGEYSLVGFPVFIVAIFAFLNFIKSDLGKPIFDRFIMKVPVLGTVIIKGNLNSFSRTLATMLSSGVSLIDALDICVETVDNTVMADDIRGIRKQVVAGKALSDPLKKVDYFPPMVAQMIQVGEQTGQLDTMLEKVSDVFEDEVNEAVTTMTKMIEPLIIVVLGGIVATILVGMYLPVFMSAGGA